VLELDASFSVYTDDIDQCYSNYNEKNCRKIKTACTFNVKYGYKIKEI